MNILNRERQKSLYFCCDQSVHASSSVFRETVRLSMTLKVIAKGIKYINRLNNTFAFKTSVEIMVFYPFFLMQQGRHR